MQTPAQDRTRKRPLAVTLVGAVAVFAFFFYGVLGVLEIINAPVAQVQGTLPLLESTNITLPSLQVTTGVYLLLCAIAALLIGWGVFRIRRWAWIAFMAWCIFILTNQIVRYFAGVPSYPAMVLAAFIVLALNQAEVQEAFGIVKPQDAELELGSLTNNPLDSD